MANGLTGQQLAFVAAYLGKEARHNATKAALIAGYSPKTAKQQGSRLLTNVDVQTEIAQWREQVKVSAITDISYRVDRLHELETRLWGIVDAREQAYRDSKVIGGDTGLVVMQYKMVGSGPDATLVEEYVADVAVVKAIQSVYDDTAKELGQRVDKVNVSGNLTREYVIVRPGDAVEGEG